MPCSMTFCCLAVSFSHGASRSMSYASATDSSMRVKYCVWALRHGRDRTVGDRLLGVGDDQLGVDLERGAQAVARLARAVRRVEREVARRRLVVARAAHGAGEVLAERERLGLASPSRGDDLDLGDAVGEPSAVSSESVSRRSMPSRSTSRSTTISILCCSYRAKPLVALQELVDVDRLAVDAGAHVALAGEVVEQRVVLALAAAHDRRQHLEPGALGQLRGCGRRSAAVSGAAAGCRRWGSAARRCGRTAAGGSRRPR